MCLCLCVGPVSPGVYFFMDVHSGKVTVWSLSDMRLLSSGLRALA